MVEMHPPKVIMLSSWYNVLSLDRSASYLLCGERKMCSVQDGRGAGRSKRRCFASALPWREGREKKGGGTVEWREDRDVGMREGCRTKLNPVQRG